MGDAQVAEYSVSKKNLWKDKHTSEYALYLVWATSQMIEEVARASVPKMLNAAGKRMSIRELFNEYDAECSGTLYPAEMTNLLGDLTCWMVSQDD